MFSGYVKFFSTILLGLLFFLLPQSFSQAQSNQSENDLSFFVNSTNVFYGFNSGSGSKEIRFRYEQQNRQNVIYFDRYENNQFITFGAYTNRGVFILIQDHPGTNPENYLSAEEFKSQFESILFNSSNIFDLEFENFDDSFVLPESNLIVSDKSGNYIIFHTSKNQIELLQSNLPYYATTYLHPYTEFTNTSIENGKYIKQSDLMSAIDQSDESFSIENGFDILTQFYPSNDRVTSIMISPHDNQMYVSLDANAEEIWRFDINGGTVETHSGFDRNHKANIPKLGITTSDLSILNFSNENLTVGIILIATGILFIILIPTVIIFPKLDN